MFVSFPVLRRPPSAQLFEIRYICNLIANPMDLSLLRVSVKVIDSRSGEAEAMGGSVPETASE